MNKNALIEELKEELEMVDKSNGKLNNREFLNFVYSTFPPKHKKNRQVPNSSFIKKDYMRMAKFYHPDKIDTIEQGDKYKILCEEISKRINGRFAKM